MNAKPGNGAGSFAKITSDCGSGNYNLFSGMSKDGFIGCVQGQVAISSGCGVCFFNQANYAVDNCKMACIANWCSQSCLSCNAQDHSTLVTCTGSAHLPQAPPC